MINIKNRRILIKTFTFESGLWYLAKSLGDALKEHNYVAYIPKSRFIKDGRSFRRAYSEPKNLDEFKYDSIDKYSSDRDVESQISKSIRVHNPDLIISFETMMHTGQWVSNIKSRFGIEVYDVPMPEWVLRSFYDGNSYSVFDKILCLTDVCYDKFSKKYSNSERVSWNYVDKEIFYIGDADKKNKLAFYHAASTNPECSHKNTKEILKAFVDFSSIDSRSSLVITGKLSESEREIAKSCPSIKIIDDFLSREDIASIYRDSGCVLAVSKKEGLGLSLYEAIETGCSIITTNYPPMDVCSDYLCTPISYNDDESLIPAANIGSDIILEQLKRYYKDINMASETKVKDIKNKGKKKNINKINEENEALASALSEEKFEPEMSQDVLRALKEKSDLQKNKNGEGEMPQLIDDKSVSINIGVIGVGQAGSRIAEEFHTLGYDVGVINTSAQDLEFINVMPSQKLLIEGSLGGTGKDLDLGRELFSENESLVLDFANDVLDGNDMVYLAISGGGGTGSSSVDTVVPLLFNTGMPVGVIYVLPKATEDAQSKKNSIESLARLAKMASDNLIASLVVVDNARIEQIYANLSQSQFWKTANSAIVEPMHLFNTLTSQPSQHTSMDPSDFGKIVSCGDCSIYGVIEVDDYMEETSLAEAVIESLNKSMLAEGFNIAQTRVGGVIITGPKEVLDRIPAININYCFHMISEQTEGASIYQGIYNTPGDKDSVKIYSWFAGLGLPQNRIDNLKKESKAQAEIAAQKERARASAMNLDLEDNKVNSVTEEVNRKIRKKKSGFNKLQRGSRGGRGSIIDRRKRK